MPVSIGHEVEKGGVCLENGWLNMATLSHCIAGHWNISTISTCEYIYIYIILEIYFKTVYWKTELTSTQGGVFDFHRDFGDFMVDSRKDPTCWERFNCPDTHGNKSTLGPQNHEKWRFKPPLILWFINYNPPELKETVGSHGSHYHHKTTTLLPPYWSCIAWWNEFSAGCWHRNALPPQICFRWFSQEHGFSTSRFRFLLK